MTQEQSPPCPYPEDSCAELGCLFIKKNYEGHGYGRAMCRMIEQKARDMGFEWLFAISQSAVSYFRDRLHYAQLSRSVLPASRRQALEQSGRSSEVFGWNMDSCWQSSDSQSLLLPSPSKVAPLQKN